MTALIASPSPWRASGVRAACKCSSCSRSSWDRTRQRQGPTATRLHVTPTPSQQSQPTRRRRLPSTPRPACGPPRGHEAPFLLQTAWPLTRRKRVSAEYSGHLGRAVCPACRGHGWGPGARASAADPEPARPSPAAELDGLVEPLLIHGLLHLLCLKENRAQTWGGRQHTQPPPNAASLSQTCGAAVTAEASNREG